MEWNGMETDMAHTDWSQLWSTGRSDRVASLSLSLGDDDGDDVILPSYPHRHTRTFVPCLHTSSAACYTGLRRLAVVMTTVVDGTVCGDRLTIGGLSTWIPHASHGHVDTADVTRRPINRPNGASTLDTCTYVVRRDLSTLPNRTDANTGIPNTAGPAACDWVQLLARIDIDTAGPYRAHDRPPSRTTKTATLYTNPATSWQIDVRDHVNTLIVVDLSKPQVD